ncbi:type I 3-dehydroquinate dehydratase [Alkalihalobacillus deserti]|uniref:type I 3-dehydroquinate dehydratase n=1 Tax=Alkalihalobacillus deserti TaxID=2879466 RepID=UPI001D15DA96|nr:type I 3-dehydroquinate dehydratase [Alkalihalobacillus deserti]
MNGRVAQRKSVKVRGIELGDGNAQICIPLVGKNKMEIISELEDAKVKKPDLVEWRADFFENLNDTVKVVEMLSMIRNHMEDVPILFTIRSTKEGGNPILLTESEKIKLIADVCATNHVDIIDYELINEKDDIIYLRMLTNKHNVKLVLSYHNFEYTPELSFLLDKCVAAESYGADLVKISVMSLKLDDVLLLLQATQDAGKLVDIPLVTISMGKYGAITRMFGFVFGSTITFGMGQNSSAPGQIPVEELRSVIEIIKKSS